MTAKFQGVGDKATITAPTGGLTKDTLFASGDRAGVVLETVSAGEKVSIAYEGEFLLPKKAGATLDFAIGEKVVSLTTGGVERCVPVAAATGGEAVGWATAAAATGATEVQVKLGGF